jgi:hypothetical protein
MRTRWRSVLVVMADVMAVSGAAYVRVLVTARQAIIRAEESLAAGRPDDALFHYRRAAHAYAPLNPWNSLAYDRLWQMGRKAELTGDQDGALQAYRAIRSAILAARSLYTPHAGRLEEVDGRIARLMARQPAPAIDADKSEAQRMHEHLDLLRSTPEPDPFWSLVLVLGFASWVGAAACFIVLGLTRDLAIRRVPALASAAAFVVGMGLWLAGLFLA